MKHFLYVIFILFSNMCLSQKYVLVDKKMSLPVTYANTLSTQDNYKGYFPVDKTAISEFISEIEKISKLLADPKKKLPEKIHFLVGSTTFHGLKVVLRAEERMDIILTTDYGIAKSTMHLCDAKISNASNAFYITTWLKYLRSYIN